MTTLEGPAVQPANATAVPSALSLQGVSKRYGAVQALSLVSVECRAGEVHAVLGENGSGKSTLLGVASGVVLPDTGTVEIGGRPLPAGNPAAALQLGLAIAYQTYSLIGGLTVAENLFLAVPSSGARLRRRQVETWAGDRLRTLGVNLEPGAPVEQLTLADRQMLEVAKALINDRKVLLLDEPTTALGPEEVDKLHNLVLQQVDEGMGVLYVSHRLPEILRIAYRVTVLRDGVSQGTHDASTVDENDLLALMIGRPVDLAFPSRIGTAESPTVLSATKLRGPRFGPVDLELAGGEIVGLAGADGNGQKDLLRAIAGAAPSTGEVRLDGKKVNVRSPRHALRSGVMLISGDRLRESLFGVLSVRSNASAQSLGRFARLGFVRRKAETRAVQRVSGELRIRTPSVEQPVRFLSGGNQQKVVLSRLLLGEVKVLLIEEPTQGVDVRSRFEIYEALRALARDGLTIVLKSSDPIELSGLCDRVLVMSRGAVTDELMTRDLTEERIVGAFVRSRHSIRDEEVAGTSRSSVRSNLLRRWASPAFLALLLLVTMAFAATRSDVFLSDFNINSLLLSTLPLSLVAVGQLHALLVGEFDISVGATLGLIVVLSSFVLRDVSAPALVLATLGLLVAAAAVGVLNAGLTRLLSIPSIIATIATLSVLQGIGLLLRPTPGGSINLDFMDALTKTAGWVPYAFLGLGALTVLLDLRLFTTRRGLITRAVGFDDASAVRLGLPAARMRVSALLWSAVFAGIAGLFVASQVGVGDARLAGSFTLASIAAAVLGGATLSGGRGSFVGALLGALFLSLILNVLPLLGWSSALGDISRGAVTLLALALAQVGLLLAPRVRRRSLAAA